MALNIKNEDAHRMALELAGLRGVTVTQAVTDAIRRELEELQRAQDKEGLAEELLEIGRRCATRIKEPLTSADHAEILYDENGLPK